jgi:hypothetical protein
LILIGVFIVAAGWAMHVAEGDYTAYCDGVEASYRGFGQVHGISCDVSPTEKSPELYVSWKDHPPIHIADLREDDVRNLSLGAVRMEEHVHDNVTHRQLESYDPVNGIFNFRNGRLVSFYVGRSWHMDGVAFRKTPSGESISKLPVDRTTFYEIFGKPSRVRRARGHK